MCLKELNESRFMVHPLSSPLQGQGLDSGETA